MNAYEATMKAADWIEKKPQLYNFSSAIRSPATTHDGGCLIGWIAYFAGEPSGQLCGTETEDSELCQKMVGCSFKDFIHRMGAIEHGYTSDSGIAAKNLRAYADRYLKPAAPEATTPDWLAIATATNAYKPAAVVS